MKPLQIVFFITVIFTFMEGSTQLDNLIGTPIHNCIKCLCHARTGCFRRQTCASYSISYDYWLKAGSPTLGVNDPENMASYRKCMQDENCILNTIKFYTDGFSRPRCDCNDVYDCRDMLMLHLNGNNCQKEVNPSYAARYNKCASENNLELLNTNSRCTPDPQ